MLFIDVVIVYMMEVFNIDVVRYLCGISIVGCYEGLYSVVGCVVSIVVVLISLGVLELFGSGVVFKVLVEVFKIFVYEFLFNLINLFVMGWLCMFIDIKELFKCVGG